MVHFLRRFSLGVRSTIAFGAIGLIVLCLGVYALNEMGRISEQLDYVTEQRIPSTELVNNIDREFLRVRVHTANVEAANTAESRNRYLQRLMDAKENLQENQRKLQALVESDRAAQLLTTYQRLDKRYWTLHDRYLTLINNGNTGQANQLRREQQLPLTGEISAALDAFLKYQAEKVDEATKSANKVSETATAAIIIAIVLTVGLVVLLSVLFTKSIVPPIREALAVAERISQKDLTYSITPDGNDEITALLTQLQHTQQSLRESIYAIVQSSEQLATTSEELSSVTNDSSQHIQDQSVQVDQAAQAISQLTAAIEAVAGDAQQASKSSDFANDKASQGGIRVQQTEEAIEKLTDEMTTSSSKVIELAKKVNDITKVLEVIREIAEQTNLLALNAAIEAARAGESGRGFSVVADEVRALAKRTQESTVEIEDLVAVINSSSSESVSTMERSVERAGDTLKMAKDAEEALDEIVAAVAEIKNRNASIASASEQQASASRVIDQNLVKVKDLSNSTASGAEQTSVSADELARLAASLNELTSAFRL
ncbi:methyl-accepting chemotaxis protein [Alteromonas sp. ASW11-19]|uniref:Methyl-accepting chemotaxis protein n=1 Tax=Alteromonas salexigens TaxID=2982530 RepID=A0ABT2VKQ2_9ALTE|nr:methyl-accepting chemotaxis protein [Alteromonas salexigens]MCU7553872.1 methyl-accepting chemotaxis protein [Alteromonas salexigens]